MLLTSSADVNLCDIPTNNKIHNGKEFILKYITNVI